MEKILGRITFYMGHITYMRFGSSNIIYYMGRITFYTGHITLYGSYNIYEVWIV
ncbi:hypothetical protein HanIR_Chr07g0333601 [Helianthus annuus]|nr:hypothetical protein HanIR_Chr07g0333601 [Helianthus annuus]